MDPRDEEDSGTHNEAGGRVGGDLIQIGNYFDSSPSKRWLVFAGLPVLAVLATVGGVLALRQDDPGPLRTVDAKVRTEAVADSTADNWECGDSAVVPGLDVGAEGLPMVRAFPRGGVRADGSIIEVTLQGTTREEIVLTGARTVIVSRRPPAEGAYLAAVCASDVPVRAFEVDLDVDDAPLVPVPPVRAPSRRRSRDGRTPSRKAMRNISSSARRP
ncbi:hypothetical protein [Streptomyces sp. NPDC004291]